METNIHKILFGKRRKRFLVQTGNQKITATFIRDGKESWETNIVPRFDKFIQVICYSESQCIEMLKFQNIEYSSLHEVKFPLFVDGVELHRDLFTNLPPHLKN